MAAKINKTVKISLKDGSMGPVGSGKTVPGPTNVMGGGTRIAGSTAGFKTRNDGGGGSQGKSTGVKTPGFGAAKGIQANKGNSGGDGY